MPAFANQGPRFMIYGLRDPRNGAIRYVGKSSKGMLRPTRHGLPWHLKKECHRSHWIKQLRAAGYDYEIVVLQACVAEADLNDCERFWIAIGKAAGTLTNATDGGEGVSGHRFSEEAKRRLSEAHRGYVPSIEHREKLSKALSGRKKSAEHVANAAVALKARLATPESKAKRSAISKAQWSDPALRSKMSAALKAAWYSPKRLAKLNGTADGIL